MVAITRENITPRTNDLTGTHVLSIGDLNRQQIELVLNQAKHYETRLKQGERLRVADGYVMATLFYEPSTRTRLSFESAMHRLGGAVISTPEAHATSSAVKGESLGDSIRTVCSYADVIVLRHPAIGSAQEAAHYASEPYTYPQKPIINAGDGAGEHPTQALLDLYTIMAERRRATLSGLHIVLAGDLKYGRTVHSLSKALCLWENIHITLASPDSLRMPAEIVETLMATGAKIDQTNDLHEAACGADVLYMTRIQKERFTHLPDYEAVKDSFIVDEAFMNRCSDLTLMHPLPRVNEITPQVDRHPNAAYFRQVNNGLYVRMALLALVLGKTI